SDVCSSDLLRCRATDIALCSTGLIGVPLAMAQLLPGITQAHRNLTRNGGDDAAQAIMTTDTVTKQVHVQREGWSIGGIAKGAGMLAPGMATMLVVLTTDAQISAEQADAALRAVTRTTFDRVDSDGCMSTNDTVVLLTSGASAIAPSPEALREALHEAAATLARALVADAEGASHDVAVTVHRATSETAAEAVARAVTRSNLVKTAIFGNDPNWGRIISAAGTVP